MVIGIQNETGLTLTAPLRNSPEMSNCTHRALKSRKPAKMTPKYKGFLPPKKMTNKVISANEGYNLSPKIIIPQPCYLKRVMNSLNPSTAKATIAHGGGNQLLLRLWAS